jgi:hypothetical protein
MHLTYHDDMHQVQSITTGVSQTPRKWHAVIQLTHHDTRGERAMGVLLLVGQLSRRGLV